MDLQSYLQEKLAPSTLDRYLREITFYKAQISNVKEVKYTDILAYLAEVRKQGRQAKLSLHAIQKYYSYLVFTKQREDNPAATIRLRDQKSRDIQLQDLFTCEELESLLKRVERYALLENRNKAMLSLLIYQGISKGELLALELENIDLEKGEIFIKSSRKINARTLKLQAKQVFWLLKYMEKDREKLLKENTKKLFISKLGKAENGDGIRQLLRSKQKQFFPRKLNVQTIRQSVIANLLKQGKDLRVVQVFAGHKYPSSTEKYKQTQVEELKIQVLKYHPLA